MLKVQRFRRLNSPNLFVVTTFLTLNALMLNNSKPILDGDKLSGISDDSMSLLQIIVGKVYLELVRFFRINK